MLSTQIWYQLCDKGRAVAVRVETATAVGRQLGEGLLAIALNDVDVPIPHQVDGLARLAAVGDQVAVANDLPGREARMVGASAQRPRGGQVAIGSAEDEYRFFDRAEVFSC